MAGNFPLAPWHMWGSSVRHTGTLQAISPSPFTVQGTTVQMAKIAYARPDTWSFLFGLFLLDGPEDVDSVSVTIRADFEVAAGIGRSVMWMRNGIGDGRGFARITLPYTSPFTQVRPFGSWMTVAVPPASSEASGDLKFLQNFPAQDIQCQARIFGTSGVQFLGREFTVEAHAYFAPRSHIRPEWFAEHGEQFRGHETGGT